jgi:hypothetical protein
MYNIAANLNMWNYTYNKCLYNEYFSYGPWWSISFYLLSWLPPLFSSSTCVVKQLLHDCPVNAQLHAMVICLCQHCLLIILGCTPKLSLLPMCLLQNHLLLSLSTFLLMLLYCFGHVAAIYQESIPTYFISNETNESLRELQEW